MRKDRPGYKRGAKRKDGSYLGYWVPQRAVKGAPEHYPTRRIPDDLTDGQIADWCAERTNELRAEMDDIERGPEYDGTISSLILLYRTDPMSPYTKIKASSRQSDYEPSLRLIDSTVGKRAIAKLKGSDFKRWYDNWGEDGKVRRAHGAIRKLRTVLSYGMAERYHGCDLARTILSAMRFEAPKPRQIRMEYVHAQAIVKTALEQKRPSIALTQAMQWDCALRRIHIIGEWIPVGNETGGIIRDNKRWQGPTVMDIRDNIFTPMNISAKKSAPAHDLSNYPLVQMVLNQIDLPNFGPLIVSEVTGLPYANKKYAADFRRIARIANVPDSVWSMDSRAGAITEIEEVTNLDDARKIAGHTDAKTTLGYVRSDALITSRRVAEARRKLRE